MKGSYWPWIAGLLFFIGLLMHQVPLLLVALLLLLVRGITVLWERYSLRRIEFRRQLSTRRAFFGEEVVLELDIANRKPLPLPWLEIEEEMPEDITLLTGTASQSHKVSRVYLTNLFSLGWYHRVRRRYRLRCDQRGYFTFGPTQIRSGDLFGFSRQQMDIETEDHLIVYPRVLPVVQPGIPSKQPQGNIRIKRFIFQDPVLTRGVREYQFGDSLKRIHWKTSARLGRLQTKVFEPTTSVDMGIFLDVRTVPFPGWGSVTQLQELGVIAAASIANHAMKSGYRVGLYVNQLRKFTGERIRIAPSQHSDQFVHILEALAQVHSSVEITPMHRFVTLESRNLPWGSTILVITAVPSEALLATMLRLKRAGRSIALVKIGGTQTLSSRDGLRTYYVPDDVSWRDLDTITLQGIRP